MSALCPPTAMKPACLGLIALLALPNLALAQEEPMAPPAILPEGPRQTFPGLDERIPGHTPSPESLLRAPSENPLNAEEFDALTRGRTFDTFDAMSGLYGIETFLSGKRVIWRDAESCMHGTWEQVGEQICFSYDRNPDEPVCWNYFDREDWILGHFRGYEDLSPILLYPVAGPVTCDSYLGA